MTSHSCGLGVEKTSVCFTPESAHSGLYGHWQAVDRTDKCPKGQLLTKFMRRLHFHFGSKADMALSDFDVRFTPESGHSSAALRCPLSATSRHCAVYSITSSARESSVGGIVRPSVLAVCRLMTSSNFVGCSTGRSAGLSPFRILSTYAALRR